MKIDKKRAIAELIGEALSAAHEEGMAAQRNIHAVQEQNLAHEYVVGTINQLNELLFGGDQSLPGEQPPKGKLN